MAVNYNRRKSNITNRDWSNYSEKQNANYMAKQLDTLGYKVPSYMKKGQINQKQIENYTNRLLNKLTNLVEKQRLSKMTPAERRRETQSSLQKDIDEYNKRKEQVINSIPKPLKNLDVFMDYYTKGGRLINTRSSHGLSLPGNLLFNFSTVKEAKNKLRLGDKKLKSLLKEETKNLELLDYETKLKELQGIITETIDRILENSPHDIDYNQRDSIIRSLNNLDMLQLLELKYRLVTEEENINSVFDSIYDKDSDDMDEQTTIKAISKVVQMTDERFRYDIYAIEK